MTIDRAMQGRGVFLFLAATAVLFVSQSASAQWTQPSGSSNIYKTDTNGNVGIGTSSPASKLEVDDTSQPTYKGRFKFGNSVLTLEETNAGLTTHPYIQWIKNGVRGMYLGWGDSTRIDMVLENGRNLAITGGNVGIGTTTPGGPIDVRDSSGRQILWNMVGAGHTFLSANGGNAHVSGNLYFNGTNWNRINAAAAGGMWWAGNDGTLGVLQTGAGSNPVAAFNWPLFINTNGKVGIGTNNPDGVLHVSKDLAAFSGGDVGQLILSETTDSSYRLIAGTETSGGYSYIQAMRHGFTWNGTLALQANGGNVGIGTTSPGQRLSVVGTIESTSGGFKFPDGTTQTTAATGGGAGIAANVSAGQFGQNTGGGNYSFPSQMIVDAPSGYGARLVVGQPSIDYPGNAGWGAAWNSSLLLNGADSTSISFHDAGLRVDTLRVAGGTFNIGENVGWGVANTRVYGNLQVDGSFAAKYQDVAEWVPSSEKLAAGTVVVLDQTKSNQVVASTQAYDTRVAGVISAQPGIMLGEKSDDKVLVATTGRVRVMVNATKFPINIGDLLVTSDIPGFAMKSIPVEFAGRKMHMPGTIIGKALEPLEKGSGAILVLLSLQ